MKRIIILGIFFMNSFILNAQTTADYTVYYDFTFVTDTVNNTFSSKEEFMLFRVGQESRFISSGNYYNDSIGAIFAKEYPQPDFKSQQELQKYADLVSEKLMVNKKPQRTHFKINKNFDTGNFISIRMFSILPVEYMEESMNLNWEITNKMDTILGLPCIKATTSYGGRNYNAWFTLAVPINDGPYVFSGLPGLILKVMDDKGWYNFSIKNIITEKISVVINDWIYENSQKIDRKTFVDKMIGHKHNPSMPAGVMNFPEEKQLERKKAFEKRFDLLIEQY